MIDNNELKCIMMIIEAEKDILNELGKILNSVNEPQLRSELQNVISSHRNHISKIVGVLDNNYE